MACIVCGNRVLDYQTCGVIMLRKKWREGIGFSSLMIIIDIKSNKIIVRF